MSKSKQIKAYQRGDVILDTYLVEDVRSGGMGNVYIAEHKKWKLKLAIKAPNEKILSDKGLFNRVLKEADAWIDLGLHNGKSSYIAILSACRKALIILGPRQR